VDLDFLAAVAPVELSASIERWRLAEFLVGEVELIGTERAIILESRPGRCFCPIPKKPPKLSTA